MQKCARAVIGNIAKQCEESLPISIQYDFINQLLWNIVDYLSVSLSLAEARPFVIFNYSYNKQRNDHCVSATRYEVYKLHCRPTSSSKL